MTIDTDSPHRPRSAHEIGFSLANPMNLDTFSRDVRPLTNSPDEQYVLTSIREVPVNSSLPNGPSVAEVAHALHESAHLRPSTHHAYTPEAAALNRVIWWAQVLGVSHWYISVAFNATSDHLLPSSVARIHRTDYYDKVVMMFRGDTADTGIYAVPSLIPSLDKSIVHELLHLVTDEWDRTEGDICTLIPDAQIRRMLTERLIQKQEQVIENLAEILTNLAKDLAIGDSPPPRLGRIVMDQSVLGMKDFSIQAESEPDGPTDRDDTRANSV